MLLLTVYNFVMKVLPKIYIIGAGLSGAVLARLFAAKAYQVKIYEMKSHLGGNCYDYINKQGIMIQKHGPHIFHTDKLFIFNFLKRFTKFNTNSTNVLVNVKNKLIDLPINFQSIDVFFPKTANEIKKIISLE
jgi:UDP-galactopyranose mutase